ncbi:MAG: carboxypeptidase regulatory-like domain-containing protein [Holophagaceae bacterium]|nr:carboxypeptidase regulatory-like domain-containing protein [Holophagaceae bacterium]
MRLPSLLAVPACLSLVAQSPMLVRGFVYDAKGAPVAGVEVQLLRSASDDAPVIQARTGADGYFLMETREKGIFRAVILSPSHKGLETPVLLNGTKPVDLTARLNLFAFDEASAYRVIGRLAGKPLPKDAALAKQADGTWAYELPAKDGETWVGALRGPHGAILPSRLDETRVAGGGLLGVVKAEGGKLRIVADPKAYARDNEEGSVVVTEEAPEVRVLFRAMEEAQRLTSPLLLAMREAARTPGSTRPDAAPTLKALRDATKKATPITRPVFMLSEAAISELGGQPMPKDLAHDIIVTVGSASPIWSLFPSLPAKLAKAVDAEEGRTFLAELIAKAGDAAVRRDVRMDALESALERGDLKEARTLHADLVKEWGQNPRYAKALQSLDPEARKVAAPAKQ